MQGLEHGFVRYRADPLSPVWKSGYDVGKKPLLSGETNTMMGPISDNVVNNVNLGPVPEPRDILTK